MATKEELDYIIEAAARFYAEAGIEYPDNVREYYESLNENPLIFTIVDIDKGFIVGVVAPSFLEPSKLACSELAWYVESEYRGTSVGIKLMKRYEQKAIDSKCDTITMVALDSLNPEAVGEIYKKLGYTTLEHHYRKEL
jgi:GNAT superfamily N-acetyltransferase